MMTHEGLQQVDTSVASRRTRVVLVVQALIILTVGAFLGLTWVSAPPPLDLSEFAKHPRTWMPTPGTVVVCGLALLTMAMAPRRPLIGLWVYLVLAYGFPRYRSHHIWLLHSHLLEWIALLAATGWVGWQISQGRRHQGRFGAIEVLFAAFLLWMAATILAAALSGGVWQPSLKHHPIRFTSVAVMFGLAHTFLRTPKTYCTFGMVLGVSLLARTLLFPDMIRGDGDVAALAVLAAPILALAAWLARPRWFAAAPEALLVYLLWVLSRTHNRGAAVALAAALIVLWLQSPRKLKVAVLVMPMLAGCVAATMGTDYWQRFADIWQGGPQLQSVLGRFELWRAAWEMFCDHPIFGVGPGNYYAYVADYAPRFVMYGPHSNVMALLSETGLPGPVLYLALLLTATTVAWRIGQGRGSSWYRPAGRMVACALVACLLTGCFIARVTEPLLYVYIAAAGGLAVAARGAGAAMCPSEGFTMESDS